MLVYQSLASEQDEPRIASSVVFENAVEHGGFHLTSPSHPSMRNQSFLLRFLVEVLDDQINWLVARLKLVNGVRKVRYKHGGGFIIWGSPGLTPLGAPWAYCVGRA